jgi:hypothetical protein
LAHDVGIAVDDVLAYLLPALLPMTTPLDTQAVLRQQARQLFKSLVQSADRETLLILYPLLARLNESMNRSK